MKIDYEVVDNMVKFSLRPFHIPHAPFFQDQAPLTLDEAYWMARRAHMMPVEALVVAAQWAHESASGKSDKAVLLNNYFGIKQYKNYPAVKDDTHEYDEYTARMYKTYSDFIHYLSPFNGFVGRYVFVRENSRYEKYGYFDEMGKNAIALTKVLVAAGYATDPQYLNKMSRYIYDLYASKAYIDDMDALQLLAQGKTAAVPQSPIAGVKYVEPAIQESYYVKLARVLRPLLKIVTKNK